MKHLKTYTRFLESNSEHTDEITSVINDMCLELKDKGYVVEPQSLSYGKTGVVKGFRIVVVKSNDDGAFMWQNTKRFYFQDIKQSILEMTEYLESEGFSIDSIDFIDASGVLDGILKDGNLYTKFSQEEVNHLIDNFIIRFIKSDKTNESSWSISQQQLQEDIEFISDTCLELDEKGFKTSGSRTQTKKINVVQFGKSPVLKINETTPYFIIGHPRGRYFKFSEIKDELLQIKYYLDERWIKCGVLFESEVERVEVFIDEKDYDQLDDWFQTSTAGIVNLVVFFNI